MARNELSPWVEVTIFDPEGNEIDKTLEMYLECGSPADQIAEFIRELDECELGEDEEPDLDELQTLGWAYCISEGNDHPGWDDVKLQKLTLDELEELGENIAKLGTAYSVLSAERGEVLSQRGFEEMYQGTYEDAEAFAVEHIKGMGDLPDHYEYYFDHKRFGEALLTDYSYVEHEGQIIVYR